MKRIPDKKDSFHNNPKRKGTFDSALHIFSSNKKRAFSLFFIVSENLIHKP